MKTTFLYKSKSGCQGVVFPLEPTLHDGFVELSGPSGSRLVAGEYVELVFPAAIPGGWWRTEAERMLRDVAISTGGVLYDCNGSFTLIVPSDDRALQALRLGEMAEGACSPAVNLDGRLCRLVQLWREGLAVIDDEMQISAACWSGVRKTAAEIVRVEPDEPKVREDGITRNYVRVYFTTHDPNVSESVRIPADWPEAAAIAAEEGGAAC